MEHVMETMTRVQGLPSLLESVAQRLEGNVDGLSKELLLQSAKQIRDLECVADVAMDILRMIPKKSKGKPTTTMVSRRLLMDLSIALTDAGRETPSVTHIKKVYDDATRPSNG